MSVGPGAIIDTGPALTFLGRKDATRILYAGLGSVDLLAPEQVEREVIRKSRRDKKRLGAAEATWKKVVAANRLTVLPDDEAAELSAAVQRLCRMPMSQRMRQQKDLGELMGDRTCRRTSRVGRRRRDPHPRAQRHSNGPQRGAPHQDARRSRPPPSMGHPEHPAARTMTRVVTTGPNDGRIVRRAPPRDCAAGSQARLVVVSPAPPTAGGDSPRVLRTARRVSYVARGVAVGGWAPPVRIPARNANSTTT
jgi:hypothetical protein